MLSYIYLILGIIIFEYIRYINSKDKNKIDFSQIRMGEKTLKFNEKHEFYFGVGTASHQNEGNNKNNWSDWEDKNNLEKSGLACNQWENFDVDLENMKYLGINSYRFSLEWSRIFPSENEIDYGALEKYKDWCNKLVSNNITPFITLHHFTRPCWVDEKYGGLHNKEMEKSFLEYTDVVTKYLGKYVKYWITFNEPILEIVHGYIRGTRPPGLKMDLDKLKQALFNVCDMHSKAYDIIHRNIPSAKVSIAKNVTHMISYHDYDIFKAYFADEIDRFYNRQILDALTIGKFNFGFNLFGYNFGIHEERNLWKKKLDFIGLNHYNISYVKIEYTGENILDVVLTKKSKEFQQNDMGWDMCHYSMYNVLKMLKKYNLPIIITENGTADNSVLKSRQISIMNDHILCIQKAMEEGVIVKGYTYWTLNDNFEWEDGRKPRFGLFKTDFEKVKRKEKNAMSATPAAKFYKKIIKEHMN